MIKPKHPKNADPSQLARSIVEHAIGEPLTPIKPSINTSKKGRVRVDSFPKKLNNQHKKHP